MCPSRELSAQTHQFVKQLSAQCSDIVSLYELGQEGDDVTDKIGAAIVCGTPGRFVKEFGGYYASLRNFSKPFFSSKLWFMEIEN